MSRSVRFPAGSRAEAEMIKALWERWYRESRVEILEHENGTFTVIRTPPDTA